MSTEQDAPTTIMDQEHGELFSSLRELMVERLSKAVPPGTDRISKERQEIMTAGYVDGVLDAIQIASKHLLPRLKEDK